MSGGCLAFLPSTVAPENFDAWKTILPFWRPFGNFSTNRTVRLQGYKNQTYIPTNSLSRKHTSIFQFRCCLNPKGMVFFGTPNSPNMQQCLERSRYLKIDLYRVLNGRGCPSKGGNWGTRIPREDWGTLGNIRED